MAAWISQLMAVLLLHLELVTLAQGVAGEQLWLPKFTLNYADKEYTVNDQPSNRNSPLDRSKSLSLCIPEFLICLPKIWEQFVSHAIYLGVAGML